MGFADNLSGFDDNAYMKKIHGRNNYSDQLLQENIYKKRRMINSSKTSAAAGAACAHISGGMSLLGTAWSVRTLSVEKQKLKLLEEEWERRGSDKLKKRFVKDTLLPVATSAAIGTLTYGADVGVSNLAAQNAMAHTIGDPLMNTWNSTAVSTYYTGIEKGVGYATNKAMDRSHSKAKSKKHRH